MFTKLDAALSPNTESTLTPYEKAARRLLAYALAGKLGAFDLADQQANQALEAELLVYEDVMEGVQEDQSADLPPSPSKPVTDQKQAPPATGPVKQGVPSTEKPATIVE